MEGPSWDRKASGWRNVPPAKLLPGDAGGELPSDALFRRVAVLQGWAAVGPSRRPKAEGRSPPSNTQAVEPGVSLRQT